MDHLEYAASDGRVDIRLDRPDRLNALTVDVEAELVDAFRRGEREGRVIVVTGVGEAFCAGFDFKEPAIEAGMDAHEVKAAAAAFQHRTRTMRDLTVPVVARVNGPAAGGGCDLALAADFRIASDRAEFIEPFSGIGAVPVDGGTYLLPRLVGELHAKEIMMLGEDVSAEAAADLGIVNETVAHDRLDDVVDEYVETLLAKSPTSLGQLKHLLNRSLEQDLSTAFDQAAYAMAVCLASGDFETATQAFREDRRPDFS